MLGNNFEKAQSRGMVGGDRVLIRLHELGPHSQSPTRPDFKSTLNKHILSSWKATSEIPLTLTHSQQHPLNYYENDKPIKYSAVRDDLRGASDMRGLH